MYVEQYNYKSKNNFQRKNSARRRKAGVFIYDTKNKQILIIQSCSAKWGIPKGSIEENELTEECAVRELREESGLNISVQDLKTCYRIDRAMYFYVEHPQVPISVQSGKNNDATGVCWIKINCLIEMCQNGDIEVTSHFKKLVSKFLNIRF
jgi:8-oxo-dGTP pyrophosphatase MutT (NUDIX family)